MTPQSFDTVRPGSVWFRNSDGHRYVFLANGKDHNGDQIVVLCEQDGEKRVETVDKSRWESWFCIDQSYPDPTSMIVSSESTDKMDGGTTRQIVMWWGWGGRTTGKALFNHLKNSGCKDYEWIRHYIPDDDHVPSKAAVAAVIWRSMFIQLSRG